MIHASRWRLSSMLLLLKITIIILFLAACSGTPSRAPIVDAPAIPTHRIQTHIVAPGETLYSIAMRYDLDHKKLSQVNDLGRSNRIVSGQKLNLDMSSYRPPQPAPKPAPKALPQPENTWQRVKSAVVSSSKDQTKPRREAVVPVASSGSLRWEWPIQGKVLERFNPDAGLNKGIDIDGKLGEPVNAAADGEVVYSGSGLRGYGKLLIVKHNEKYLSAYAHNRVLHVTEGDKVRAGQRIAEVGLSGTNTAKLHFEIRLDGKPVDPLKYLPQK